jgi:hypothetical protein
MIGKNIARVVQVNRARLDHICHSYAPPSVSWARCLEPSKYTSSGSEDRPSFQARAYSPKTQRTLLNLDKLEVKLHKEICSIIAKDQITQIFSEYTP